MYLATEHGEVVPQGAILRAVIGTHTGRYFRFVDVHEDGQRIVVRHHGAHPFRHSLAVLHPMIFGCVLEQEIAHLRAFFNRCHHAWQRIEDGLWMGALALVPLALFEAYHGGEMTRHLLESLFNSHANTGGH